jgi:hypothetical protein
MNEKHLPLLVQHKIISRKPIGGEIASKLNATSLVSLKLTPL